MTAGPAAWAAQLRAAGNSSCWYKYTTRVLKSCLTCRTSALGYPCCLSGGTNHQGENNERIPEAVWKPWASHTRNVCVCVWYYCVCVCLYIVVMFNREHTQTITTIAPTSWFCQLYPSIFNHIATNRTKGCGSGSALNSIDLLYPEKIYFEMLDPGPSPDPH